MHGKMPFKMPGMQWERLLVRIVTQGCDIVRIVASFWGTLFMKETTRVTIPETANQTLGTFDGKPWKFAASRIRRCVCTV